MGFFFGSQQQKKADENAYSRAYSKAYNRFEDDPYVEIDAPFVFLPKEGDQAVQVHVQSNTDWEIR